MKKTKKNTYRIRNWKEYNAGLVKRGSLTVWVEEEIAQQWQEKEKSGKPGASKTYSDKAIETMALLGQVYSLALRATQGLLKSIIEIMKLEIKVPDYTTLCRRRKALEIVLTAKEKATARHIVVDSTGVKIYGEGEWKVRQYGWTKRRTWRKLHIAVDEASKEILVAAVTKNSVDDAEILPILLEQVEGQIYQVSADGAYDKDKAYKAIEQYQAFAAIPPRKNAVIHQHGNSLLAPLARDENIRCIRKIGRKKWKKTSNYHRRSLAENTIFRIKTIFGERLRATSFDGQAAEVLIRCSALNKMSLLGMPQSFVA